MTEEKEPPAPCRVKLGKPVESAVHPYRKVMSNVSSAFPNLSLPAAKNGLACAVHASPKKNSPISCQKSHLTISLLLNPPVLFDHNADLTLLVLSQVSGHWAAQGASTGS